MPIVPNLAGLTRAQSAEKLSDAGLIVGLVTTSPSPSVPKDVIINTSPPDGTEVSAETKVDLVVSGGLATVQVPDLMGLTLEAAKAKLTGEGLVVGNVNAATSESEKGTVLLVTPVSGTAVIRGSAVNLEISNGAGHVAVPDVVGFTQPAAEAVLKTEGLVKGNVLWRSSDSVPPGGIIGTSPVPGTMVTTNSPIELIVSKYSRSQQLQPALLAGAGFLILFFIGVILADGDSGLLRLLADTKIARGLITFLIAIATVGIAIILAISTVLTDSEGGNERFDRGKQVLTILIGVLGTIVGFYFGSTQDENPPQIQTTLLPVGTVAADYKLTIMQSAGLTPPLNWSVAPALPEGLVLDPSTGAITGKPVDPLERTILTFTVTDEASPPHFAVARLPLEVKAAETKAAEK